MRGIRRVSAMGHCFGANDDALSCPCGADWASHQENPTPHPESIDLEVQCVGLAGGHKPPLAKAVACRSLTIKKKYLERDRKIYETTLRESLTSEVAGKRFGKSPSTIRRIIRRYRDHLQTEAHRERARGAS